MTVFPAGEAEIAALERFLAASSDPACESELRDLRQRARRMILRIANPVRVGIVGLPGSGKSVLAGFLAGHPFPPPATRDNRPLPVVLRYAERAGTLAGWWSGIEIAQDGIDFAAASAFGPDYVELRLPNPVLQHISFLDLPGLADWSGQKEQMRWISTRADVLLWCTNAVNPWLDDEWQLWSLVPRQLQAHSLLVVTQTDLAPALGGRPVAERLADLAGELFHGTVGLSSVEALRAAPGGRVADAGAWEKSGARGMVGALLTVARGVRRADLVAARELAEICEAALEDRGGVPRPPAPAEVPRPRQEDPWRRDEAADAPAPAPREESRPQPDEPGPAPRPVPAEDEQPALIPSLTTGGGPRADVLARLREGLADLVDYARRPDFKDWQFMARAADLGDELTMMLARSGTLRPEARWLRGEVDEAFVTLLLLQLEPGERPCRDAATIFLQLARDLSWAIPAGEEA